MPPRRSVPPPPPPQRLNYTIPDRAVVGFQTIEAPDFKPCAMPIHIERGGGIQVVGLHELTDEELARYASANPAMMGWSIARILARRLTGWAPPVAPPPAGPMRIGRVEPKAGKAARARAARRAAR